MDKLVLLGDEAIAQGALDSGISGVYAYPGTPSTEITEYIQRSKFAKERSIHSDWSANEKTAMEAALGMSYAGKRALVCMKHVGLNVAAEAFINSEITGVNGGLVLLVADDPSMHSSQNEQDSRFYGKFAFIPVFEPATQQECYDMTRAAYDLSEKYKLPVMMRVTTRLAHSRAGVASKKALPENMLRIPSDSKQFILLPALARKKYNALLGLQSQLEEDSQMMGYNTFFEGSDKSKGILACGIAYNYYMEIAEKYSLNYPVLKISHYPVPREEIRRLADATEEMLVFEEGFPMLEELMTGFLQNSYTVKGRLSGAIPRDGELNPLLVAKALGIEIKEGDPIPGIVANRPPALCKGCGHIDMYNALGEALEPFGPGRVFSDIGCYTLGALPPYNSINSCVDMGASVTMAKGASDAGLRPSVAVIGDSTFTHSGMTGLLDVIIEQTPVTVIISDNSTTGMTGGQKSHATDRLYSICKGLGVEEEHIIEITPLRKHHEENTKIISRELNYEGVSVIISRRECIQTAIKRKKSNK
ncbi:MAG: thiamine pyrophosphate-dependent enzyme [Bacteroidales bacterium]|jgi:indolepyruvate ferredoxin oxidoreductase alpha subunit|nr:thiamine pyrophosphate-dependent enzyme [Bacteroidales bacterium]